MISGEWLLRVGLVKGDLGKVLHVVDGLVSEVGALTKGLDWSQVYEELDSGDIAGAAADIATTCAHGHHAECSSRNARNRQPWHLALQGGGQPVEASVPKGSSAHRCTGLGSGHCSVLRADGGAHWCVGA